jgi:hypothetical protein
MPAKGHEREIDQNQPENNPNGGRRNQGSNESRELSGITLILFAYQRCSLKTERIFLTRQDRILYFCFFCAPYSRAV